jgi:hypothetical protein
LGEFVDANRYLHFDSLDMDEVKALAGLWMQVVVVRQWINVLQVLWQP